MRSTKTILLCVHDEDETGGGGGGADRNARLARH